MNDPVKAEFEVGQYSDGSGPVVKVRYDTTSDTCRDTIWIEKEYGDG